MNQVSVVWLIPFAVNAAQRTMGGGGRLDNRVQSSLVGEKKRNEGLRTRSNCVPHLSMEASQISATADRPTVGRYAELSESAIFHEPFEMEQTVRQTGRRPLASNG